MSARRAGRNVLVGVAIGLLLGGMGWAPLANVEATHDGSGWYSDIGLDTPPGVVGTSENVTHGGPDGPAEPNFGDSRPGGDWNATGSFPVNGTAQPWGNRMYAPHCQDPTTYFNDAPSRFGELMTATGSRPPDTYVFQEDVGNVSEARDGDGDGALFFDNVWFFGLPVGVNVNGVAQNRDEDATGYSDAAEAYEFATTGGGFSSAPKQPRTWVSANGTPAFAIAWLGNWTDGADGAGGGGFRDNIINLTSVGSLRNNPEWAPYRGAAPRIKGFFDPARFVSIMVDPDDGSGQLAGGVFNVTGDPPPIDPGSPGNAFVHNWTLYAQGRTEFAANTSRVTDVITDVVNGITNFTQNPSAANLTVARGGAARESLAPARRLGF